MFVYHCSLGKPAFCPLMPSMVVCCCMKSSCLSQGEVNVPFSLLIKKHTSLWCDEYLQTSVSMSSMVVKYHLSADLSTSLPPPSCAWRAGSATPPELRGERFPAGKAAWPLLAGTRYPFPLGEASLLKKVKFSFEVVL